MRQIKAKTVHRLTQMDTDFLFFAFICENLYPKRGAYYVHLWTIGLIPH